MKKVNGVHLAIFDMDGLMLDTERLGIRVALEIADRMGYPLTEECIMATVGMTWGDTLSHYRKCYPCMSGWEKYMKENERAYDKVIEMGEVPVKEGCRELLNYLEVQGIRRVVATSNNRARAELCLKKTNLLDCFERLFCSEEVSIGKPSPDIFLLACRQSGVLPEKAVVLEDSVNGLLAANAGGIRCILVPDIVMPSTEHEQLAVARLSSLTEIMSGGIL